MTQYDRGPIYGVQMPAEQGPIERRRPITVVLVDDEQLIRGALSHALSEAGLELLGEAENMDDALSLVLDTRPDVVLMDIRLPGSPQVQAVAQLNQLAPASRILILTRAEHNRVVEAIIAGASGYILKSSSPEQIVAAVRATASGESVLSPQVAGKLLTHIRQQEIPIITGAQNTAEAIRAALTERELEIFTLLATGNNNRQIADRLGLSLSTVSNHISSILTKLQLENRIQAAVHAVRAGIS